VHRPHPLDGALQVVECAFRDDGCNLCVTPLALVALIQHDHTDVFLADSISVFSSSGQVVRGSTLPR